MKPSEMERGIGKMRVLRISLQFAVFIMMFLFMACTSTSTKFSTIYKDVTYRGHSERFLVINTFPTPGTRRVFEDELVKVLKDRGRDAVVSYLVMHDLPVSIEDVLASLAKEAGADTVLINRYVNKTMEEVDVRNSIYTTYINTQTDVYDMKSNKLVFSASAETRIKNGRPYVPQIETYVRIIINKLLQEESGD